jgi:NAD(P)-dependent dehydrogenase (short-subunit alcohol dehydrogenase family)
LGEKLHAELKNFRAVRSGFAVIAADVIPAADIPMLTCGPGGAIVNVGSEFLSRLPYRLGYVTSKHGQIGLTTSVSAELAPQGIRVNLVCPGFVDTPMHHAGAASLATTCTTKVLVPRVHTRRAGRPDEIAQAIVFLCSDEASSEVFRKSLPNQFGCLATGKMSHTIQYDPLEGSDKLLRHLFRYCWRCNAV